MNYFPSADLTLQEVSESYQNLLQQYVDSSSLYVVDGLGNEVYHLPSASIGKEIATTDGLIASSSYAESSSYAYTTVYSITSSYVESSSYADVSYDSYFATSASLAHDAISSTYSLSASFADNAISSSHADETISSSYALSASWSPEQSALITGSTYPITSSWASTSVSSSYSISSSNSITSSYANNATSSSYADISISSSYSNNTTSSSYALSSSYSDTASYSTNALSASWAPTPPALVTGSTYPITSSWSNESLTASSINFVPTTASYSNNSTSSSYSLSASYGINPGYVPYVSASSNVILGSNSLSTATGLISPKLYPLTDSTASLGIFKADGTTNILSVDSTNSRIGIGTTSPSQTLTLDHPTNPHIRLDRNGSFRGEFGDSDFLFSGGSSSDFGLNASNKLQLGGGGIVALTITGSNVGIGTTTPTAGLHIKAGTAVSSSAPIKLTSGTLMTAPEVGAIEFLTDTPYFTISTGTARKAIVLDDVGLTAGRLPYVSTNGRLTNSALFTYTSAVNLSLQSGVASVVTQTIKGAVAQTADNLQIQDSSANVLAKIDASGSGYFSSNGQSIIQTGLIVNQSQDNTINGVFNVKGSNDTSLIITDDVNDRVGIGTSTPTSKLTVSGSMDVTGSFNATSITGSINATSFILTSPGNNKFVITVNDYGTLTATPL